MGATAAIIGASAIMTGATAYSQSRAQKAEGAYQSQMYEANSRIANIQAEDAIMRGDQEASKHKTQVKKLIGSQRASLAAQGVDINSGSALDVQADTAALGAEDEQTIKNNAWREAWGYKVQASDYLNSATFARLSSKNAAKNTILTAGMNIASDAGKGYYYSKSGTTTKTDSEK